MRLTDRSDDPQFRFTKHENRNLNIQLQKYFSGKRHGVKQSSRVSAQFRFEHLEKYIYLRLYIKYVYLRLNMIDEIIYHLFEDYITK